jgi:hypothetical protein
VPEVPARTYHTDQALAISEQLNLSFSAARYGTKHRVLVRLREPDGPDSDGGRKARNSLVLVPERHPSGPVLMFGWVDVSRVQAELRAYPVIDHMHRQRFGRALDLSRSEYGRLSDHVRSFLEDSGFQVRISQEPLRRPPAPVRGAQRREPLWFLAGFAAGFISAVLLLLLL